LERKCFNKQNCNSNNTKKWFIVLGTESYNNVNDARKSASELPNLGELPFKEYKLVAAFIYQTSNSYTNSVKSKIVTIDGTVSFIDFRTSTSSQNAPINANDIVSLQSQIDLKQNNVISVANQAAMLALTNAEIGKSVVYVTADKILYQLTSLPASTFANWQSIASNPSNPVNTITTSDIDTLFKPFGSIYVNAIRGSDTTGTGTKTKPFATRQAALNSFTAGSPHTIYVEGNTNDDLAFRVNDQSMRIITEAKSIHSGNITLQGINTSIYFDSIGGSSSYNSVTINNNGPGTLYFNNCDLSNSTSNESGASGYTEFGSNTAIDGLTINLTGNRYVKTLGTGSNITLNQSKGIFDGALLTGSIKTYITGTSNTAMATILRAGCQLLKDTNGKSLVCSAVPSALSVVYLMGCSTAQADGSFGKIDFTNAGANILCSVWSNSQLAPSGDVFPITGKQLPNSAMNLLASTTATNYTPTNTSVKGHLDGINTSLGLKANQSTTYTKTETDAKISSTIASLDVMVFKGVIDASTDPNYPTGDAGHTYRISVAGKIGGASGINVEIGDILICLVDGTLSGNQATVGSNWNISQVNIDGAVISNETATVDNDFVVFSGTNGKIIKKTTLANYKTLLSLVKGDVGLGNVDNTSDLNKPISTATQTALDLKENAFTKNTAFNKNFGNATGEVIEGGTVYIKSEVDALLLNTEDKFEIGRRIAKQYSSELYDVVTAYLKAVTYTNVSTEAQLLAAILVEGFAIKLTGNITVASQVNFAQKGVLHLNGFTINASVPTVVVNITKAVIISGGTLAHEKPIDTTVEVLIKINTPANERAILHNLTLKHVEFGVDLNGCWALQNVHCEYNTPFGTATDSHRHIAIKTVLGECFIDNITFGGIPQVATTRYTNFILADITEWTGNLHIRNVKQNAVGALRQFLNFQTLGVNVTAGKLIIQDCNFNDLNGGIFFLTPGALDKMEYIILTNNEQGGDAVGGFKGLLYFSFTGALGTKSKIIHYNNKTVAGALRADYVSLIPTADTENTGIIARQNTVTINAGQEYAVANKSIVDAFYQDFYRKGELDVALNLKANENPNKKVFANQTTNFTISQTDIDRYAAFEFNQTTAGIVISLSTPTGNNGKPILFKNIGTETINLVDTNSPIAINKMSIASFNGTSWNIVAGGGGLIANNSITNNLLAQAPAFTVKGNNTNATANETDLTANELLNVANQSTANFNGLTQIVKNNIFIATNTANQTLGASYTGGVIPATNTNSITITPTVSAYNDGASPQTWTNLSAFPCYVAGIPIGKFESVVLMPNSTSQWQSADTKYEILNITAHGFTNAFYQNKVIATRGTGDTNWSLVDGADLSKVITGKFVLNVIDANNILVANSGKITTFVAHGLLPNVAYSYSNSTKVV